MEFSPLTIGCIGVVVLLALCFAGVRFAFAGAITGTAGLVWLIGWDAGIRTAGIAPYTSGANYTLSVLPMFILIGYLAYYAGITQSAFEAARRWFGWLPGGLATGTVFAVAGFSAVSGASSAAAASAVLRRQLSSSDISSCSKSPMPASCINVFAPAGS